MKRIGILGGTFDPIHNGHIRLAEEAEKKAQLDEVIFMPAKRQPFKLDQKVTAAADRLAMMALALTPMERFSLSTFELDRPTVSYTCDTLQAFAKAYPKDRIYFITGTDAFLKIRIWKKAEEILTTYSFIVGSRPGYKESELQQCISQLKADFQTDIIQVSSPMVDISATEIRRGTAQGNTPAAVERYIKEHALYPTLP